MTNLFKKYNRCEISGSELNAFGLTFYKIFNSSDKHYTYQYKDGLNILDEVFKPIGDCCSGGLYFTTREFLYNHIELGPYLRQVDIPADARVWVEYNKCKTDRIYLHPRQKIDTSLYMEMVAHGNGTHIDQNSRVEHILGNAIKRSNTETIQRFVEKYNQPMPRYIMSYAVESGDVNVVKWMLDTFPNIIDTSDECDYEEATSSAVKLGNIPILDILFEYKYLKVTGYICNKASRCLPSLIWLHQHNYTYLFSKNMYTYALYDFSVWEPCKSDTITWLLSLPDTEMPHWDTDTLRYMLRYNMFAIMRQMEERNKDEVYNKIIIKSLWCIINPIITNMKEYTNRKGQNFTQKYEGTRLCILKDREQREALIWILRERYPLYKKPYHTRDETSSIGSRIKYIDENVDTFIDWLHQCYEENTHK